MTEGKIFVGREAELEQFKKILEDKQGQAILVVGQAGMGKTWLINKMAEIAGKHPDLKCGCVRYEVTSGDSVDAVMERMIDDAFHAADIVEGSFDATAVRRKQWYALFETIVPKGEKISKLISSFAREEKRPTREQFLERLRLVSAKMKDKGRAIFVIDPLEYLDKEKDAYGEDWAVVVRDLPDKVKFVFAQRPEDVLARYRKFARLSNVSRIPAKKLGRLGEKAVDELLDLRACETEYDAGVLRRGLEQYEGHPYALQGALDLLATGTKLEELPDDPTERGIIEEQWEKICRFGEAAIRLFKSYAILEVTVPDDVANMVGKVKSNERLALLNINIYLKNLLHDEGRSKRIYHLLLAKYILGQMSKEERKEYHSRAVKVYREKLRKAKEEKTKPDALAAVRLAEHVLEAEGKKAYVYTVLNETGKVLMNLGFLDACENSLSRSLKFVEKGSEEETTVTGNLGLIYETRGELDKAEEILNKSLEINKKLGQLEGMAINYGNLGLIYEMRGQLDEAEEMQNKALEIDKKLGRLEGMANQYGNLGVIYRTRGELDKAEEMFLKILEIHKKLGDQEGLAKDYGNLGLVYYKRGDLDKAEKIHNKALEIAEKLGLQEGMANSYGNLGVIYKTRGELDKAEKTFLKIVEIHKRLGSQEGLANDYVNLGAIYKQRGDVANAREYWEKALELYKKIGMKPEIEKTQGWIEELK